MFGLEIFINMCCKLIGSIKGGVIYWLYVSGMGKGKDVGNEEVYYMVNKLIVTLNGEDDVGKDSMDEDAIIMIVGRGRGNDHGNLDGIVIFGSQICDFTQSIEGLIEVGGVVKMEGDNGVGKIGESKEIYRYEDVQMKER